jgi:isoamylase
MKVRSQSLLLWGTAVSAVVLLAQGRLWALDAVSTTESRYGAHVDTEGWVHFVVHCPEPDAPGQQVEGIDLLLYAAMEDLVPNHTIPMERHESGFRIKVRGNGIGPGQRYMYRVRGQCTATAEDQYDAMYNEHYPVNDPYAYQTDNVTESAFFTAIPYVDITSPIYTGGGKSVVYNHDQDPAPIHVDVANEDLIIYEMHVQDYTALLQELAEAKRGTYAGLAQGGLTTPGGRSAGIDHIVELGVTAVELLPIHEYDEETSNEEGRYNHWGYMSTNFFAPETRYALDRENDIQELKQLIQAFHERGIAVFMDVVYNHTGEGQPWIDEDSNRLAARRYNLMGLANQNVFWPWDQETRYRGNSGCGNDLEFVGGDRYTKKMVCDSLALWHTRYGIDGFRFDQAVILNDGSVDAAEWVDAADSFSQAHLHAEPWVGGSQWYSYMDLGPYNAGNNRWAKWVSGFRQNIRKFADGKLANPLLFKQLIEGYGTRPDSPGPVSSRPPRSVNYVAVHDGHTMRDSVSFNDSNHICSDSHGDEDLRRKRQKLMMGTLLTSHGVPLILQGDEIGRTKSRADGESLHNSYNCESTTGDDNLNRVNWIDWKLKDGDNSESPGGPQYGPELFDWTKSLIELRKRWTHFRSSTFPNYVQPENAGLDNDGGYTYAWEGPATGEPIQVAVIWWGDEDEPDLMVAYNESPQPLDITNLGAWSGGDWKVLARSWYGDAHDFADLENWQNAPAAGETIQIAGRAMAVLISDND